MFIRIVVDTDSKLYIPSSLTGHLHHPPPTGKPTGTAVIPVSPATTPAMPVYLTTIPSNTTIISFTTMISS
jgi:hypothetical protein